MAETSKLPTVNEAIEISIKRQKQSESVKNRPSWNIEEEKTVLELMNEDAKEMYK